MTSTESSTCPSSSGSEVEEPLGAITTPANESERTRDTDGLAMKLGFFSGELPHDDLDDLFRLLHRRSKSRRHPFLAQFINESLIALTQELNELPLYLRELVPPIETILDLSRYHSELRKGLLCGAVERVVLCTLKIGLFIS
jgi:hypothetical protein